MTASLPEHVREQILGLPEHTMAAHKVALTMEDGSVIEDVKVAWGLQVVRVGDADGCPLDVSAVVGAEDRSTPGEM